MNAASRTDGPIDNEPLVIVGSRLQAITAAAVAGAIAIALVGSQPAWTLACIGLWAFAASRLVMRLALHPDRAEWRTWRGSTIAARPELAADMGHRYIELASGSKRIKIEVPVEIRPNVRKWVDAQPPSSGLTDPSSTTST